MSLPEDARVVVVGAGLGGLRVAEELRRLGHAGPLALVGEEAEHPYDRPPLSKEALRDGDGPAHLRPVEEYPALDLDLRLGRAAVALDPGTREVRLDDGTALPYDAVVLAPGATPRTLPGVAPRPGLHVLRTHADAVALRAEARAAGRLVVVGGGFVGCEAAASARALGLEVDLVELLAGPLVRAVGPGIAARVADLHRERGVRLHTGTGVADVHDDVLVLSDGRTLPAPVVLVGLGVVPATGWLAGSGLDLAPDGAVRCDAYGRAGADGVWALGDAAAWQDATGTHRRVEHWTAAVEQAATVAANLLGDEPVAHTGVPYFWSDQYGVMLQAVGEVAPETEVEVLEVPGAVLALHGAGDRLLGVVGLDAKKQTGRARRLLRAGASLQEAREALSA